MRFSLRLGLFVWLTALAAFPAGAQGAAGAEFLRRLASDASAGKPFVAHATVAVSSNPAESPWWGGASGVNTVMGSKSGWKVLNTESAPSPGVLERKVFTKRLARRGGEENIYLVADAWEEKSIQKALLRFYAHARGAEPETVTVTDGGREIRLQAGGDAQLAAYLGRNGMEDIEPVDDDTYNISPEEEWLRRAAARPDSAYDIRPRVSADKPVAAMVLCPDSKAYFLDKLKREGAYPLLLTVGTHQPEAWALEGAIVALAAGKIYEEAKNAAAEALSKGSGTSRESARLKLWSGE